MAQKIETVSIADEARRGFLIFQKSAAVRAIPDVRDGLKPVQRRILFGMSEMNLTADRKSAKSAQIVGRVMGDYHPHGNLALYDAMVRLSQSWVMRLPLVDGQGNFGSVDGDPPAADRYTEARLSRAAEMLLSELGQDTVPMRDNYTATKKEPEVLPAQYPNLIVNGTAGIAVGLATSIPPHNLGEVLRACVFLIENPDATVAQLLDRVKGPDFPLGGKILTDRATLRKIYEEGRGSIKVQAEWKLEELPRGRQQIVITSIPYGIETGPLENVIGAIIESKRVPQLLGQGNESNEKEGMRIVLDIKPDADPNLVMAYLYKHTELQKSFSYNVTCLVPAADGVTMVPRDGLSLKDLLQYFLDFRFTTVRRRFEYELEKLRRRIHILDGFRIVFNGLDKAIKIIRTSTGKQDASTKLQAEFELDEEQATAILDSQLYKIAQMEIQKILEELAEKRIEAERIESILKSKKKLWGVITAELEAIQSQDFVVRRRTRMATDEDVLEFNEDAYIVRENTNVVLTRDGWVKRVGRLSSVESTRVREGDAVIAVVPSSTLDHIIFLADDGTAYTMRVNEVPASSGYGEPISKYFKIADQVKIIAAIGTDPRFTPEDRPTKKDIPGGPYLVVATSAGNVLRLPLSSYRAESTKAGRRFVKLDEADKVVFAQLIRDETGLMLASQGGHVIHFELDQVNILSGVGKGVIGMKLDDDDVCIGGGLVTAGRRNDTNRFDIETESGRTEFFTPERPKPQNRGGKGEKPWVRTRFARVIPPVITLVNWDDYDDKPDKKNPDRNGTKDRNLFE